MVIVTDRMLKGVYSRDEAGDARLYIDGVEVAATTVGGDFSNRDPSYQKSKIDRSVYYGFQR